MTQEDSPCSLLLHQLFEARAQSRPHATALVDGDAITTYGELDQRSNQLARALIGNGAKPDDRVCFMLPKSPDAVVAILGVLKAGCIYTPLDPQSPPKRVRATIDACDPSWILADASGADLLTASLTGRPAQPAIAWMGAQPDTDLEGAFDAIHVDSLATSNVDVNRDIDDAAYILFTSGSTGTPKGVVITHHNVSEFVAWANVHFGVADDDRQSAHSPLHFDLSVYDLFGTLAAGAELHLVPPEVNLLPNKVTEFIRDHELTQWFSVPSVLNAIASRDVLREGDFPALRRLLWCGEVLPTPTLIYWMERLPHVRFTNLYGPTETTIASSYFTVPSTPLDPGEAVPIGRPCAGEELLVLDEHLESTGPGTVGDLYIGGVGLSPGYWRDEAATAAAFTRPPSGLSRLARIYRTGDLATIDSEGLVYFRGRSDRQIKSRGYRIELDEIAAALANVRAVRESAVVAVESSGFEGTIICAAYVAGPDSSATKLELRKELGATLPTYMLPTSWLELDQLPSTPNGKIDHGAIRSLFESSGASPDGG